MARPIKQGVDYFPLDVHFDTKFKFIKAKFGWEGIGIVISIYQHIYSQGFWTSWTNDDMSLYADENAINLELLLVITQEVLKRRIFDKNLYEKYQILTSRGIQRRYFKIAWQRTRIEIEKNFLLIEFPKLKNENSVIFVKTPIFTDKNRVIINKNPATGQKKLVESHERKEKKRKEKKNYNKGNLKIAKKIIIFFNQTCGTRFNFKSKSHREKIDARIAEGYSINDFKLIIEHKNKEWHEGLMFTNPKTGKETPARDYLRPSTLFNSKNFDEYLNKALRANTSLVSNLKSKEEIYKILKTALKASASYDETLDNLYKIDHKIHQAVKTTSPFFFEDQEKNFSTIYRKYQEITS